MSIQEAVDNYNERKENLEADHKFSNYIKQTNN